MSLNGSVGAMPYRASYGYTNQDGILKTSNFERHSVSLGLDPKFLDDHVSVNFNFKGMFAKNRFPNEGAIGSAVTFDPTKPVRVDDPKFDNYFSWQNPDGSLVGLAPDNPLALLEQKEDRSTVDRYITNASFDYRFGFLPALRANLNLGYDKLTSEADLPVPE